MHEVKAYRCDHCGRYKLKKSSIVEHEKICFKNKDTRSCATCLFYDKEIRRSNIDSFLYEVLFCHRGVRFYKKDPVDFFDTTKPKLRTACQYWVERPEDEEEKLNLLFDWGYAPGERLSEKEVKKINEIKTDDDLSFFTFDYIPF